MLSFILLVFTRSVYLGLDIGSYFSKASLVEGNEIPSIYYNSDRSPNTPSFFAFRSKPNFDWRKDKPLLADEVGQLYLAFGDNALRTMETRPWMGCGFWPLICNLNSDEASKYTRPFGMNSSASRVKYEDSLILYLKKYIDSILGGTGNIKDVCFVFPASFIIPQRYIFEYALKNFKIEKFHNIDDIDAVSYVYGIENSESFQKKSKTVLFIDVGGMSIKSYVVRFVREKKSYSSLSVPKAFRYSYVINRTEGGSHVTRRIVQHIRDRLDIKNITDAEFRRLFRAAEKMKIDLSNQETTFSVIENINGIDFQFSMNRTELVKCLTPLINTTAQVALEASKGIEYDDIEIIGGSSKIEYVVKSLSKILHHEIRQSLPAEETLALGAGYSNSFRHNDRFVPVEISEEKSVYSVKAMTLNGTYEICEKGEKCHKKITVQNDAQLILFNYGEDEIQQGQIVTGFGFYLTYIDQGDIKIFFKNGPLRVHDALSCETDDQLSCKENKVEPLEPPKPLSDIFKMFMHPELINERLNETREQLTNFTYLVLHQVEKNQTFRAFSNFSQRIEIIRCAEKQKKWLLTDAKKATQPINFTLRLNELKKLVFPVYQRIKENITLYEELGKLLINVQNGKYGLDVSWPVNRSYVQKSVLNEFKKVLLKSEKFLNDTIEMTWKEPGWKSFPVTANDVKEISDDLKFKFNEIQFAQPPPSKDNPYPHSEEPPEYWEKLNQGGLNDDEFRNDRKIESYEDFVKSKKNPYSTDDL